MNSFTVNNNLKMKLLASNTVSSTEQFLNALALFLLAGQFALIFVYYFQLPETIPVHFGLEGKPDRWGGRGNLLVVPIISIFICSIFWGVRKIPADFYNMPTPLTPENRERQVRNTHEMLAMLAVVTLIFMDWTLWDWVRSAANTELVRSKIAPIIFMVISLVGTTIYYVRRAYVLK